MDLDNYFENRKLMYKAMKEARIQGSLAEFPKHGEGVHDKIMEVTTKIAKMRLWVGEDEKAHKVIREAASNCGREITESEIQNLLDGARDFFKKHPTSKKKKAQKFPVYDRSRFVKLERIEEGALIDSSPIRGLSNFKPSFFLKQLFPDDSYICVGSTFVTPQGNKVYPCKTRKLLNHNERWLNRQELVVPAQMTAEKGVRKEAKDPRNPSPDELQDRGLNNTGKRLYLVIESDVLDKADQEIVLYHFSQKLPLAMIVDSAGKSYHGWFNVEGKTEEEVVKILKGACRLGADERMKTKCQLCRLPNGLRKGQKQTVLYFNPENTVKGEAL